MELDDAYENGAYIPGAAEYPEKWASRAAEFRAAHGGRLGLRYGSGAREVVDIFLPDGEPEGLMVFVHGGYWKAFDGSYWSHLAGGAIARGWAVAVPTYTLAPEARISQITQEVTRAVSFAAGEVAGPVALCGHSAGGHLVARMCVPGMLPEAVAARLCKVVPISPVADLRPLLKTTMNETLGLDAAEAEAESPVLQEKLPHVPVTAWVGGDERPAFLDQARWLADAWRCGLVEVPGQHHFSVVEALAEPGSPLMREVLPNRG
ncbi:Acetyl esterase/lipase [Salinihabitans flavidus]|uniref:Acetyl esterase/lipase n=1 Tax=Salinihabitans flavidus TaxID=569882 RepID=A0A1H8S7H6_9RHOB|nr:alpha/beta hydrolase [Salinihabitans flavidus]SEO74477.1 Acetyl esterase/lipase [Salinihabitans flavidus]